MQYLITIRSTSYLNILALLFISIIVNLPVNFSRLLTSTNEAFLRDQLLRIEPGFALLASIHPNFLAVVSILWNCGSPVNWSLVCKPKVADISIVCEISTVIVNQVVNTWQNRCVRLKSRLWESWHIDKIVDIIVSTRSIWSPIVGESL